MEKLVRNKHSSLLQKFVNYGQKSFITFGPGKGIKLPNSNINSFCNRPFKIYLHVRFQGAILHKASTFQRIEIIFSKPAGLMRNQTEV
jgi:hypothetical protein